MVGMMVLFATGVEDPSKLNVEAADKAPFFDLTVPKDVKDGNKMWDAFAGYSGCLDDIVREKLPKLMEEVQDLAGKAQGVGENATEEIDKLGAMQKAKAVMILPKNVKLLQEQPDKVKAQAEKLRTELQDLQEGAATIKETMDSSQFKDGVQKLKEKPAPDARMSYREVFGMPAFNEEQWNEWKEWAESKKIKYSPKDYGKE